MFLTTIDAAPRNGVVVPSSTAGAGRAAFEALPAAGFSGAGRLDAEPPGPHRRRGGSADRSCRRIRHSRRGGRQPEIGRLVVGEELVPRRVDCGRVVEKALI
jgi:hypothetical protein